MATPKVMHGARALVYRGNTLVGSFHNITWNVAYDTQDAYVLGRLSPAEIGYTAQEPISGSLTGWRVVKNGPHVAGLPELKNLLEEEYTTIVVVDRVTGERISQVQGVRLLGSSGGVAARQFSEMSIPYKGLMLSDESVTNAEPAGSADLP